MNKTIGAAALTLAAALLGTTSAEAAYIGNFAGQHIPTQGGSPYDWIAPVIIAELWVDPVAADPTIRFYEMNFGAYVSRVGGDADYERVKPRNSELTTGGLDFTFGYTLDRYGKMTVSFADDGDFLQISHDNGERYARVENVDGTLKVMAGFTTPTSSVVYTSDYRGIGQTDVIFYATPIPGTLALAGVGFAALGFLARRRGIVR